MTTTRLYKVKFNEPPLSGDDRTEFFFTSLSAIYEMFTVEQIGCGVRRLWNLKVAGGNVYQSRHCTITSDVFTRRTRNNPCKGRTKIK